MSLTDNVVHMNPYKPPETRLIQREPAELQRSVVWKLYFVLYGLLSTVSFSIIHAGPQLALLEFVSLAITALSVTGLFGYVFARRYFTRVAWRIVFYIALAYVVAFFYLDLSDLTVILTRGEYWIVCATGCLLVAPMFYALCTYSRRGYPLWSANAPPSKRTAE